MNRRHAGRKILQFLPLTILSGLTMAGWCFRHPVSVPNSVIVQAADQPYKRPSMPQPWVSLANPDVAQRMQIAPEHRAAIARIDADLGLEARKIMQDAIKKWHQNGGFNAAPLPNFRDPATLYGNRLKALQQTAENKIVSLLSEDEKSRWQQMRTPMENANIIPLRKSAL